MYYAIVDIETTGGYAASNGITEIAVFISDGKNIVNEFHTLLNPYYTIPRFIESLTGITNEMVESAPDFKAVSGELFELLHNKIFVAHNVNFDYSFLKHHFQQAGFSFDCKKLCTIRLSRQIIPGLRGYGLDKVCRHLEINISGRHRAKGDAEATVTLFHHLIKNDPGGCVEKMLKANSKESFLPPNVSATEVKKLPHQPGVYYFHDKKGKPIYVGKAKNIFKRVNSHFSNNKPNNQKQEFLKKIYSVTYKETATELMAFILESAEIRKLWPEQNCSQKRFEPTYGLYQFVDGKGFIRLCIEKKKRNLPSLYSFNLLVEGYNLLKKMIRDFDLCPRLCFLQAEHIKCDSVAESKCTGECENKDFAEEYNRRVLDCIHHLNNELPSFALLDKGFTPEEPSCFLIEKGKFYGMGYLPQDVQVHDLETLKVHLTAYAENDYIRGLIYKHAEQFPFKKVDLRELTDLTVFENNFG